MNERIIIFPLLTISLLLTGCSFFHRATSSDFSWNSNEQVMYFHLESRNGTDISGGTTPVESVIGELGKRLDSINLKNYQISEEKYDTLKLTVSDYNDVSLSNIKNLMTFDPHFALSSKMDDFLVNDIQEERFLYGDAYTETKSQIPAIHIPVSGAFNSLLQIVKNYKYNAIIEAAERNIGAEEGDEISEKYSYHLYLWQNYEDGDTFSKTISSSFDYDPQVAKKILMSFDIDTIEDNADEIITYVSIRDSNNNSKYETKEIKAAFETARFYVALLNSNPLDYKLTFISEQSA